MTRLQGGLIGNVRAGTLRPEVDAVAMAMKPGEVSEILEGPGGLTLLYCERVLDKVVRSPEELRNVARKLLRSRAFEERWAAFQRELLEKALPTYHWQVLARNPPLEEALLVEYLGGALSVAEVVALVGGKTPAQNLGFLPRSSLEAKIASQLGRRMMLREVVARGLGEANDLEIRRTWTRRRVLAAKALAHLVAERFVPLREAEIEEHYRVNRQDFVRPVHYRLAVIALPIDPDDIRRTYRQGELLVHQLRSGAVSFDEAARQHSQHPSGARGGDVGWVSRPAVPQRFGIDFLRALLRLEVGETSDIVQDGTDVWIVTLRGVEEERPMTFEEARVAAENQLGNLRAQVLKAEVLDEWLERVETAIGGEG